MKNFLTKHRDNLTTFLLLLGSIWLLTLVIDINIVRENSMYPTISDGDIVVGTPHYDYRRGSIISFKNPEKEDTTVIKRIVGMPGETVSFINGFVHIDGKPFEEIYATNKDGYIGFDTVKLKEDEYFVLGDNRNGSRDSSNYGPIHKDSIINAIVYY